MREITINTPHGSTHVVAVETVDGYEMTIIDLAEGSTKGHVLDTNAEVEAYLNGFANGFVRGLENATGRRVRAFHTEPPREP